MSDPHGALVPRFRPQCRTALFGYALVASLLSSVTVFAQLQAPDGTAMPVLVQSKEFAANPSMVAEKGQVVVFDATSAGVEVPIRLGAGAHSFCVTGAGGSFTSIRVTTEQGRTVPLTLDGHGCVRANLRAGVSRVALVSSGGATPAAWMTASLITDDAIPPVPPTPLTFNGSSNTPVGGYWAIQDLNYNGRGTFGNRILSSAPQPGNAATPSVQYVDPSTSFDGMSLWQLPDGTGNNIPALLNSGGVGLWSLYFAQMYVVTSCGYYCGSAYTPPPGIQIQDQGNYQFQFNIHPGVGFYTGQAAVSNNGPLELQGTFASNHGDEFQVLFRFYPDGTAVNGLQEGEVGLFQGCGGTGKAAIFIPLLGAGKPSPPYNLTALSSPATTLDGTAKAVRIGNGSSIYWGQSATTPVAAVVQNTDCLNVSPRGNLYVEPVSTTIVTAHNLLGQSCLSCSFVGQSLNLTAGSPSANFQKWKFDGADFSHSSLSNLDFSNADMKDTKFVGATLSNVKFTGAIVDSNGLDFSGATLTNVDFSGMNITNFKFTGATLNNINLSSAVVSGNGIDFTNATLNQVNVMGREPFATVFVNATLCGVSVTGTPNNLVDLTSGNFAGVHVVLSNTCAANLSYTNLAPSATIGSQWAGLNLTGAVITGLQGKVLSTKNNPLDLTGAVLTGVSMQGAVLDYAKGLAKQNLTAINLNNASLRFANLQGAVMYGASLQDANLEGCNMNGVALIANPNANVGTANLQGAFLRDVNLSEAQLNGAVFSNANFYGETAVGTGECTPDPNTGFTDGCATASHAVMNGTIFNGAYLFGVDFTQTTVQGVNFGNSFLVGANFAGATISSAGGSDSGFGGAFLQGTNMAGVVLENKISLLNAYVDFSPTLSGNGNTINLVLNAQHTTFAGYWNQPGEVVCAQMSYAGATVLPTTSSQITCPDGNQYTNGCGAATPTKPLNLAWESRADITTVASYLNPATYTAASGQMICNADVKWVPLSLGSPHPRPPKGPKKPKPPMPPKMPIRPTPPSGP